MIPRASDPWVRPVWNLPASVTLPLKTARPHLVLLLLWMLSACSTGPATASPSATAPVCIPLVPRGWTCTRADSRAAVPQR